MPDFDLLHPRAKKGTAGGRGGEFIDIVNTFTGMGGEYDKTRNVWRLPTEARSDLDAMLDEVGYRSVDIPEGMQLATPEQRKSLKVPPAWTDVFVAEHPGESKVLAIGFDRKGKKQFKYSDQWTQNQAKQKFERIRRFVDVMPTVDEALTRDAPTDDTAAVAMLQRKMGLRIGTRADVKHGVHGATTLQRRHVRVTGDTVYLDFIGKKGVRNKLELEDKELARVLKRRLSGKGGKDPVFATNGAKVGRWINGVAGDFFPHDFRRHLATSEALILVQSMPMPKSAAEAKRMRLAVGQAISDKLGNDRDEALKSYIDPAVFGEWEVLK